VPIPVGEIATKKVECPAGEHVLGGGQYIFSGTHEARLTASRPFDSGDAGKAPDDGWQAAAAGFAPSGGTLTVNAICGSKQPAYEEVRAQFASSVGDGGRTLSGKARCPDGTRVISGGGSIGGDWNAGGFLSHLNPFPSPDERPHKGWELGARDNVGGPSSFPRNKARIHAICSRQRPVYATAEAFAPPNSWADAAAECPAGTDLLGGGVWAVLSFQQFMTISTFFDDDDPGQVPDDGWLAETDNTNGTFQTLLRTYAICRP
jgi:hypothetical protein